MTLGNTALVLPAPEAEPLVSPWRARHDRSAGEGVPAHVTLLYPFVPPDELDPRVDRALAALTGELDAFDYELARTEVLSDILTIAVEPHARFEALRERVLERWPALVPYGGRYGPRPRLHITVAWGAWARPDGAEDFAPISRGIDPALPLRARADQLWLMERRDGLWSTRAVFPLLKTR